MNARLEEEYARYIAEHKGGAPGDTVTINIKDVAQHFYNLALEDVKKEVEKRIAKGSSKYDVSEGAIALDSLLDFLDDQK